MDTKKLDLFCALYKDDIILDKFSLIDIMIDLQVKTKDLQSLIWNAFPGFPDGSKENDDLIYNTISDLAYDKGADIEYIDKWLNEFEISIDDIVNNNLGSNEIGKYISVKYIDFKGTEENKKKAHLIQVEFLDYFLKFHADNFQSKIYSGFDTSYENEWTVIKQDVDYSVEFLNSFCKSIFDEIPALKIPFNLNYEKNIKNFASKLHDEISDNVLNLSDFKIVVYLDYISKTLKKRQLKLISSNYIDEWIIKYSLDKEDFPYFDNQELNVILSKDYKGEHSSVEKRREVFKIQRDFFLYASMIESNRILEFINSLKNNLKSNLEENNSEDKDLGIDPIFKSKDGFETFNYLLNELGIEKSTLNKKGVQATLNAIWGCSISNKIIFKDFTLLKEYVKYLNDTFNFNFNGQSMSKGIKHHHTIEELLANRQ